VQPRIELWQLRYFVALAEEQSFRRAAERLSITQPPLTRQIRALEEEVGGLLFERRSSGVVLTATGEHLLVESRRLLASADALFSRLGQRAGRRASLRLGITTVVDASLFTWVEPAVAEGLPGLRLVQKRQISQRSIADLRRGGLDLAIIGLPSDTTGLTVEPLTTDPLVAAIPERHRLARRRSIDLLELGQDPLFWFARPLNPAYFDHFGALFRGLGFDPPRLAEPPDHHVLLGLIADGQGVALIPRSLTSIARTGVLYKALKASEALTVGIAVAYPPGRLGAPSVWLLRRLREHFGSPPPRAA
jgi:DNA-binding transcriptional LysR family regulator